MSDIWDEIDEIVSDLNIEWQKEGEISVIDLMEHYGIKRGAARERLNKLFLAGWKKYKRRRRGTGALIIVASKEDN